MTPIFRCTDTNALRTPGLAHPRTPSPEARLPWVPAPGTPSDVLATFDTISRRLRALADTGCPEDPGPRAA